MTFHLTVNMDNAAFTDHPATELYNICIRAADEACRHTTPGVNREVFDSNGNRVGSWEIKS